MRVTVVGTGYVGLVTGTCFSAMGNNVFCVDTNHEKIEQLKQGKIPIFEPGLDEMVTRSVESGDLKFTTRLEEAIEKAQVVFIAVGTPMGEDGSADLSAVLAVAEQIGTLMKTDLVVVDKSTVPVGTADRVRSVIQNALQKRVDAGDASAASLQFDVVSNPEFLKEGSAISDFMKPDRVIVGADSVEAAKLMESLYEPFMVKTNRLILMDTKSAEITKYASNAMLASRISFMNEIARLCEHVGANVSRVRQGMGSDSRIGNAFLFPGCGYGGSCFPKDVQALIQTMKTYGIDPLLLQSVEEVNRKQKGVILEKVLARFGHDLSGKTFAVWGLAFKPNTDDMREAPAIETICGLTQRGAKVRAYDPEAMEQAKSCYLSGVENVAYGNNKYDVLDGANALLLLTEWPAFRSPDFDEIKTRLVEPIIFDGRNQFEHHNLLEHGFEYYAIGIPGTTMR